MDVNPKRIWTWEIKSAYTGHLIDCGWQPWKSADHQGKAQRLKLPCLPYPKPDNIDEGNAYNDGHRTV